MELLLTVDLGDRREGVLPGQAGEAARRLAGLPGRNLSGIAVNFACLSGQLPSVDAVSRSRRGARHRGRRTARIDAPLLSLGGTCCLQYLAGYVPRFRTEIRSGGGPLYGYDFVSGAPLDGLERVDPVLSATVLESFFKPPAPPAPPASTPSATCPTRPCPTSPPGTH